METTLRYGGNWYRNQTSTGASLLPILAVGVIVGHGHSGAVARSYRWFQDHWSETTEESAVTEVETTPAEKLQRIRDILSPGVSTLATIFGVSRQTVYNWLSGEQPRPEHLARLKDLTRAADVLAESGIPITGFLLKRPIAQGKHLFEVSQSGGSAEDAARRLVQTVRYETEQRQRFTARFAGRRLSSPPPEADFPAENDLG